MGGTHEIATESELAPPTEPPSDVKGEQSSAEEGGSVEREGAQRQVKPDGR